MRERTIAIPTQAGQMETFITQPEDGGPFPPVVIYMDFWGVREELFDIARRVGTVGYYCLVPDLYYRPGRGGGGKGHEAETRGSLGRAPPRGQTARVGA